MGTSEKELHAVEQAAKSNVPVAELFGVPVQVVRMDDVLARVDDAIASQSSLNIGVVNSAKIVNMRKDAELCEAVLSSDAIGDGNGGQEQSGFNALTHDGDKGQTQ